MQTSAYKEPSVVVVGILEGEGDGKVGEKLTFERLWESSLQAPLELLFL